MPGRSPIAPFSTARCVIRHRSTRCPMCWRRHRSPRKLSEFRGKPLIINMWASWCGPCRAEMASLERLAWLDPAGQFTVIGISTDDYPEQAMTLLRKSNATISQFIDSKLQMENMLGATRLPLTVLIDANGRVLDKIYGAKSWDDPESLRLIGKMFRIRV